MEWVDRFTRRARYMAALQLIAFFVVLGYGLASPSLGWRVLLPGLLMAAAFGCLISFTLNRPWDFSHESGASYSVINTGWYLWDPGLIVAMTLWVAHAYRTVFESAKERTRALAADFTDPTSVAFGRPDEEWAADTYGALLLSGPDALLCVGLPLAALALLWFFLPS